jgi:predicted anti-sigma-YlaC factor YlaD
MTCQDATNFLLERLAGRLDGRTCTALDEHLRTCAGCRETSVVQGEVASLLASRPEADVPPAFAARVAGRLAHESGWFGLADWRWLSVRFAPVAALLVLVAGIVIERQGAESSSTVSLSAVVETWATGESDGDSVPVTSVLWKQNVSEDAVLLTVLTAPSDATIARQTDER